MTKVCELYCFSKIVKLRTDDSKPNSEVMLSNGQAGA